MAINALQKHLDILIEKQLSSVEFVQDYLQLHFDGNTLTCFIWPEVEKKNKSTNNKNEEYRNVLCSIISKIVKKTIVQEGVILIIEFDDGSSIKLSLDPDNSDIVAEIAIFHDEHGGWSVFE